MYFSVFSPVYAVDMSVLARALCRIKLLPVTRFVGHMDVNCFKLVYKLSNVGDDLKWATNTHTHMTPFTLTFKV